MTSPQVWVLKCLVHVNFSMTFVILFSRVWRQLRVDSQWNRDTTNSLVWVSTLWDSVDDLSLSIPVAMVKYWQPWILVHKTRKVSTYLWFAEMYIANIHPGDWAAKRSPNQPDHLSKLHKVSTTEVTADQTVGHLLFLCRQMHLISSIKLNCHQNLWIYTHCLKFLEKSQFIY